MDQLRQALAGFDEGTVLHTGDDVASTRYASELGALPSLAGPVMALAGRETPASVAAATEFILEGLHLSKRLNKESAGSRATYHAR